MTAEVLLAVLRLAHALSAAAWVGLALAFALHEGPPLGGGTWWPRDLVRLSIGVFLVTGAIMTVQRLSTPQLPPLYFALLAVKVALGLWMFSLARRLGRPYSSKGPRPERMILALGVVVYALAMALRTVHDGVASIAQATGLAPWS